MGEEEEEETDGRRNRGSCEPRARRRTNDAFSFLIAARHGNQTIHIAKLTEGATDGGPATAGLLVLDDVDNLSDDGDEPAEECAREQELEV
jgi:hypothetical protein